MKKTLFLLLFLLFSFKLIAQVGINTTSPQATLDVVGNGASSDSKDGIRAPRVTKRQLAAKSAGVYGNTENGSLVYVTDVVMPAGGAPSLAQTSEVLERGYYYFDGNLWKQIINSTNYKNLYNSNGALTGDRIVSQGTNALAFTSTGTNGFSVDGTTFSVDAANHRLGIGTVSPVAKLDITGSTFGMKMSNAASGTWDNLWFHLTSSIPSINASGADGGLQFNVGTNTNGTYGDGQTLSTVATMMPNGRLGVGTTNPQRRFHVNAISEAIRLDSLATLPINTASTGLVIDANGDVYKNNTASVEGQIARLGLNEITYTSGNEVGLRFNLNDTAGKMGNAPNGAPNFINTILGLSFNANVSSGAGQGSPERTTDQIVLQPGTYRIQVRLVGNFVSSDVANTFFIKSIVNNNEYSIVNFNDNPNELNTYYFDDFVNISGTAQTVEFTIRTETNNFTVKSLQSPGVGNSYRSLILIQRLR